MKTCYLSGLVALSLALLPACGSGRSEDSKSLPVPSPSEKWTIRMIQSGGFIGMLRTIEISSDGRMYAEDRRSGRMNMKELPKTTIEELGSVIQSTIISMTPPVRSACADCFVYELQINSERRTFRVIIDDSSLGTSGVQDLISYLQRLRDDSLAFP